MDAASLAGLSLTVLVTCDAAVTVLHPDAEGVLAGLIRRAAWRSSALLGTRVPRVRRHMFSLAGPVILVATFVSWISLITFGLTLAVWPMLDEGFEIRADLSPVGFLDALYFAGGTVSVLGYGDLTPRTPAGQLISLYGAAVGFTLFTGMATYAIEVIGDVRKRNRFTLSVHDDSHGRGGVSMVAEDLAEAGAAEVRAQCHRWADSLREVDEMVHRYPLVAFTYRSSRVEYDPEPALRHLSEAAVATLVAGGRDPRMRSSGESLSTALARLQRTIATTYLDQRVVRLIEEPQPTEDDRRAVRRIQHLLSVCLGEDTPASDSEEAAAVVRRCRTFLDALHAWARMSAPPPEWDED